MFVIIDTDDITDMKVVKGDLLMEDAVQTLCFETYKDAEEYADRMYGEYQIVEIDE